MESMYVVRISNGKRKIRRKRWLFRNEGFEFNERAYGKSFFEKEMYEEETSHWKKYCMICGFTITSIPIQYTRNTGYRKEFFDNAKKLGNDHYICAYCGRILPTEKVTVDHIFPVNKMSYSRKTRLVARIFGIKETNEFRNLCAACEKCNSRKRAKTGLWVIRGLIGKHYICWHIIHLLEIIGFIAALYLIINH